MASSFFLFKLSQVSFSGRKLSPPIRTENPEKIKEPIAMANCVLPEDIMLCILTRLPVKSILRFKSVCKPWRELFSTPEFTKMHHGQFSSNPKNQSVIIFSRTTKCCPTTSLFNIESNDKNKKPTIIDHPYPYINYYGKGIVGCCNGLICMKGFIPGITMWNPALNLLKFIELSNVDFGVSERVSLGFGYDAEGADFKAVRIVCLKNTSVGVEVYSVNSDSWRTIKVDFRFSVLRTTCDVIVNGNPYWVAKIDHGEVLVCFDVTNLVFKIVSLSGLSRAAESELVNWRGSLAALVCTKDDERVESLDVWVFYDGEQIWRKSYSFGPIEVKVDKFLQCSKNGKILGERPGGKLFMFDPETGCVKKVWLYGSEQRSFEIYGYTESLAYIKGMVQVRSRKRKRKTRI